MKRLKHALLFGGFFLLLFLAGCTNGGQTQAQKVRDLELTVVAEEKLPQELLETITEKKELPFKFTFQDGEYLYICIGYGEQESGGYSITVDDLYLTQNVIYVKTCLYGPSADVAQDGIKSYPYIVIKTEYLDYPVVFD